MRIELVLHDDNLERIGIMNIDEFLHLCGIVEGSPAVGDAHMTLVASGSNTMNRLLTPLRSYSQS